MTKADLKLIAILIIVALCLFGSGRWLFSAGDEDQKAVIKSCGKLVRVIDLTANAPEQQIMVEGRLGTSIVEVANGKIRMHDSPCPDKYCVHQGWASIPGQAIICVPNEVVIYIEAEDAGLDAILR